MQTVKALIKDCAFDVIVLACRSQEKANQAKKELESKRYFDKMRTTLIAQGGFDMTDPVKIEKAVQTLPENLRLNVIHLQAGGTYYTNHYQVIEVDGQKFERGIFQNMIGGHVTLAYLKKHDRLAPKPRIVACSGEAMRGLGIPGIKIPHFESEQDMRDFIYAKSLNDKEYSPIDNLAIGKYAAALWALALDRLAGDSMEVHAFSPGFTKGTSGAKDAGAVKNFFAQNVGFNILYLLGKAQTASAGGRKNANCLEGRYPSNVVLLGAPRNKSLGPIVDQVDMHPQGDFAKQDLSDGFFNICNSVVSIEI